MKTFDVGTHWNGLAEVIPMSTHNSCYYGEIRNSYQVSRAMEPLDMYFSLGLWRSHMNLFNEENWLSGHMQTVQAQIKPAHLCSQGHCS